MADRPPAPDVPAAEVLAAGGVVWRRAADGGAEIAVIHRPHRRDWSLPKGKLEPADASLAACALREVAEEAGLVCELGAELPASRYVDHRGRAKEVRWWVMTVASGAFVPNEEADELRWVTPAEASRLLDYDTDRAVLASALAVVG